MSDQVRPPIIALGITPWRGRRLNRQHILSRLAARGWPVIYSNGALWLWERGAKRWKEAGWFGGFEREEGVWLDRPARALPRWQRFPLWNRAVVRHHTRRLRIKAGAAARDAICYVFDPEFWPYVSCIAPRHVVFHAYDAFDLMPDWTPQLQDWRDRLLRRADLRIVTFRGIAKLYPEPLRAGVRELSNGVDAARFLNAAATCPADLAAIPSPRIGYFGAINPKLDFELLGKVAAERPAWHWVLLGPSNLETETEAGAHVDSLRAWQAFRALPNVHYLGTRGFAEVAAYASHMDVNTICYRTGGDGWWSFGSPNKLHEALAVGKPVVATPLETIRPFAHVVDLAETPGQWIAALQRAITSGGVGTPEERRAVAQQNTWDKRLDVLEQWLFEMLRQPARGAAV